MSNEGFGLKKYWYGGLALGVTLGVAITATVGWFALRDPLDSLPEPEYQLQAEVENLPSPPGRHLQHVILHNPSLGDIGFTLSLPDPLPPKKIPLLFVLGGLGTGANNIRYIGEAGNNAIIGYDWPMPVQFYSGISFITQLPDLYDQLMSVPGQVTSLIAWCSIQDWADSQHVSLLGFSLGALAVPSIQDLATHDGIRIGWTVLAYGGAPLGELFLSNPHIQPALMRIALAPIVELLLRPLEPKKHLPHLIGHFLVLQGENDTLIPARARVHFLLAVPQPKTVVTFEGNHMGVGPDKMELLQKIIDTSKKWLIENAAVNVI